MSQSQKRTGARDISELKARLGLNKKGPAGAGARPGAQRNIPAPPGARPPGPDPSEDPFGAMNAMATSHAQQAPASPEFVIVNDGQPVESVEASARMVKIGKVAAIAAVPLVLGVVVGQISSSAKVYNETIADASAVRDDVRAIGRGLQSVKDALLRGKERGAGGRFLPNDKKLVKELGQLDTVKPNPEVAYRSYLYELEPALVAQVFSFYTETQEFYEDLDEHVRLSSRDAQLLQESQDALKELSLFSYGAYVDIPDDPGSGGPESLPRIELVELGQPVCGNGRPAAACDGPPRGFQYRPNPSGPWGQMEIGAAQGDQVKERTLFLLIDNPLIKSFVSGADATLAATAYMQRLGSLSETLDELVERRKSIENQLNAWANESKRFTFFL